MEFCRSTLAQALKAGPLPEEERWHVLRGVLQVCCSAAGLHTCHALDNLHYGSLEGAFAESHTLCCGSSLEKGSVRSTGASITRSAAGPYALAHGGHYSP